MIWVFVAVAGLTLLITLWLSVQVNSLRSVSPAAPLVRDVPAIVKQLDNAMGKIEHSVTALDSRVTALEHGLPRALSKVAVVSYDAFGDISGAQSRSIALLDHLGDGLVLSVLVGRSETLFFVKHIRGERGTEHLSPEEEDAVARAAAR